MFILYEWRSIHYQCLLCGLSLFDTDRYFHRNVQVYYFVFQVFVNCLPNTHVNVNNYYKLEILWYLKFRNDWYNYDWCLNIWIKHPVPKCGYIINSPLPRLFPMPLVSLKHGLEGSLLISWIAKWDQHNWTQTKNWRASYKKR